MAYYLAIDIGGTNIKYGLIDEAENLIESHEMPTEAEKGGPGILGKTKALVESYLEENTILGVFRQLGWLTPIRGKSFMQALRFPIMQELSSKKKLKRPIKSPAKLKMTSTVLV